MSYKFQSMKSPVGDLYLVATGEKLCGIFFQNTWVSYKKKLNDLVEKDAPVLKEARSQLREYFAGKRQEFSLPLELHGTDFQKRAWLALAKIPYGETTTYKHQAERVKSPLAVRAVGRANGLNPICIVLPCHRVIGSNGSLTGFAGGLDTKRFLLDHESKLTGLRF